GVLQNDLGGVPLVSRQAEGLTKRDPVLTAADFPWPLDVGKAWTHLRIPFLEGETRWESQSGDRIDGPVDGLVGNGRRKRGQTPFFVAVVRLGRKKGSDPFFRPGRIGRHAPSAAEKVELVAANAIGSLSRPFD